MTALHTSVSGFLENLKTGDSFFLLQGDELVPVETIAVAEDRVHLSLRGQEIQVRKSDGRQILSDSGTKCFPITLALVNVVVGLPF